MTLREDTARALIAKLRAVPLGDFSHRDVAIEVLEVVLSRGRLTQAKDRQQLSTGLGRLLMDEAFGDSPLASEIMSFMVSYVKRGL